MWPQDISSQEYKWMYYVEYHSLEMRIRNVSVPHCLGKCRIIQFWDGGRLSLLNDIFVLRVSVWPKPHNVMMHCTWINSWTCFLGCMDLDIFLLNGENGENGMLDFNWENRNLDCVKIWWRIVGIFEMRSELAEGDHRSCMSASLSQRGSKKKENHRTFMIFLALTHWRYKTMGTLCAL